jgi:hypothetical protein
LILWDLLENASQIVNHLYAQANEIVSERYGEVGDIHTFFMSALYAEAQECISGSEDASSF